MQLCVFHVNVNKTCTRSLWAGPTYTPRNLISGQTNSQEHDHILHHNPKMLVVEQLNSTTCRIPNLAYQDEIFHVSSATRQNSRLSPCVDLEDISRYNGAGKA